MWLYVTYMNYGLEKGNKMSKEIREILMTEIDNLINGKSDVKKARTIAKLSAQVIYKDRLAIEQEVITAKKKLWFKKGAK